MATLDRGGRRKVLGRDSTACTEELQSVQDSWVSNVNKPLPLLSSANLFVLGCFHPLFSASVPALGAGGLFSVRRLKSRLQPNVNGLPSDPGRFLLVSLILEARGQ